MPLDGSGADEELGADLGVRQAPDGEARDVLLLRRELIAGVVSALADCLAGRKQLVLGAPREPFGADLVEHLMCRAQLLARVRSALLAPQPLAVEQVPASELESQPRASETRDRLAVP